MVWILNHGARLEGFLLYAGCLLQTHSKSLEPTAAMDTSYLTTQVSTIVGQLHGLFDEIGVASHERESRESEVSL